MKDLKWLFSFIAFYVACSVSVHSQTGLTSLHGTVTDPSGAAVPEADVSVDNSATGEHLTQETDSRGEYNFLQIAPGRYVVTVSRTGFGNQSKEAEFLVNQPATVDFMLSLQESKVTVEVTAEAQTLNMSDATIGNSFNNAAVEALPMEGRNVPDLLSLQPGVLYLGQKFNDISSSTRDTDSRSGAVAGARSDQGNVTLDGVDNNDQRQGYAFTGVLRSTLDSLEEFRVTTTQANADNGRSSGAQIVLVTKSGTNQFHGSIYEYNRNDATVANDFFNKTAELQAGLPNKPGQLIRNTYGASLGGPIKRDKLFFFLNYEGQRTAENTQVFQTVPTQSFRDGNLKYIAAGGSVVTLCSEVSVLSGKCPNASPKNDLGAMDPLCSSNGTCPWGPGADPNSLATFNAFPLPNAPGGDGLNTGGYTFSAPNPRILNTYIAKLDYDMSSQSRFFIRGNLQGDRISSSPEFPGEAPSSEIVDTSKGLAAGNIWTIAPNLINNFRYGYIRQGLNVTGAGDASYSDFAGLSPLTAEGRSTLLNVPVHNILDDVNWTKGKHTLQFGVNWRIVRNNTASNAVSFDSATTGAGNISQAAIAGTGQSFDPAAFGYPAVSGGFSTSYDNAVTDIAGLLSAFGANNNYQVSRDGTHATLLPVGALIPRDFKANEFEWYVQDSYRIKPNFTVTVGVRHSLLQTPYEVNGQQVAPTIDLHQWFENRAAAAAHGLGDQPEISFAPSGQSRGGKPYWPMNKLNFAPRASVAYSPGFNEGFLKRLFGGPNKTSIRAGIGVYYDHYGEGIVDGFSQFGSFGLTSTQSAPSNIFTPDDAPRYLGRTIVPINVLPVPSPTVTYPATPPDNPNGAGFTGNSNGIDDIKTPYAIASDISVQRQLPGGFTLELAYVNRRGRDLLQQLDLAAATDLVDPKSGMDYYTAARIMSLFALAHGENRNAVIPPIPFFEDLFPTAAAGGFSATQNIYTGSGGSATCPSSFSWANRPGREVGAPYRLGLLATQLANGGGSPVCFGLPPVPFWDPQFASLMAWSSIGISNYNSGQLIVRHPMTRGLQVDFSYTYAKSMDMGSDAERTNSQGTTSTTSSGLGLGSTTRSFIENPWNPMLEYAPSDFDIRHAITTNWVYQLPFGSGRLLGSSAGRTLNALIGGWQLSGLARWTTGLPFSIVDTRGFTNSFLFNDFMVKTGPVQTGLFSDSTAGGAPIAIQDPAAAVAGVAITPGVPATLTPLRFALPGEAGSRNAFRGQGFFGIDASLAKSWDITERIHLRFAWDVFNVTNSVRFDTNSIDNGSDDGAFGLYRATLTNPRVQQFSLRLTF